MTYCLFGNHGEKKKRIYLQISTNLRISPSEMCLLAHMNPWCNLRDTWVRSLLWTLNHHDFAANGSFLLPYTLFSVLWVSQCTDWLARKVLLAVQRDSNKSKSRLYVHILSTSSLIYRTLTLKNPSKWTETVAAADYSTKIHVDWPIQQCFVVPKEQNFCKT